MRILMTTRGSAGHVGPLAPFGHACLRAWHEVLVAAQRQHEANVERVGLAFSPIDDPPDHERMPLMGRFEELDIATAKRADDRRVLRRDRRPRRTAQLGAIVESWQPDIIVRESWEFGSTLVAELHGIPIVRVGLGLAAVEELSIGLACAPLDRARAEVGLPSDPAGERLRDTPFFTLMPEALEDPAAPTPKVTYRFRHGCPRRCRR